MVSKTTNLPQQFNFGTMQNLTGMSVYMKLTNEELHFIQKLANVEKQTTYYIGPEDSAIIQSCLYTGQRIPNKQLCVGFMSYLERMLKVANSFEEFNE